MFESDLAFPILVVTCFVLAAGGFVFFYLGKNGRLKRLLWPVHIVLATVVFFVLVKQMNTPPVMYKLMIPILILIAVQNIIMVRFCLSCGHTVMNQNPFARLKKCPKCNADFNNEKNTGSDDLSTLRPDEK